MISLKIKMIQKNKQLPKGWKYERFANLGKWGSGGTPLRSNKSYYGGDIKWAIIRDLNEGILFDTKFTITEEGLENSSAKKVPKDSLLIAMYGSIGKTAITGCELTHNQAIAFLIPNKSKVNIFYVKYFIQLIISELFKLSRGGTQKNINQEILKNFEIPIPDLKQQTQIVQEIEKQFTRLDASVKDLKNTKEKLEVYRKSVLKKAFEGGEGWEEKQLGEILKVKYGKGLPKRDRNNKGTIPIYGSSGNVGTHDKYLIDFPTIIVARKGSIGNNFIVRCPCWPIDTVYYLEDISINIAYLFYSLLSSVFKDTSTAIPSLRRDDLEKIPVKYPIKPEQQTKIVKQIEKQFSIIDKLEQTVNKSLNKTEQLRKSILKSAFEGKLK